MRATIERHLACAALIFAVLCSPVATPAQAACDKSAEIRIKTSNMDDKWKRNMLHLIECDTSDLDKKIDADLQAEFELRRKHDAEQAAREKIAQEDKARRAAEERAAAVAADNAQREADEAFEQAMADKCGEYPLELKLGLKEKLLTMGCAGQADLRVNDSSGVKVYFTAYYIVTVRGGKVVRLIRR